MVPELSLPWLLIATPQLADPNFHRSVVLVVEDGGKGAMGFVLNRPSEVPLRDILDVSELEAPRTNELSAWYGGPVATHAGLVLTPAPALDTHSGENSPFAITLSASRATLAKLVSERPERPLYPFRFLVGYSGWGAGQLQEELMGGAWLQTPASFALVFDTPWRELWERCMAVLGATPRTLVPTEHTYLN